MQTAWNQRSLQGPQRALSEQELWLRKGVQFSLSSQRIVSVLNTACFSARSSAFSRIEWQYVFVGDENTAPTSESTLDIIPAQRIRKTWLRVKVESINSLLLLSVLCCRTESPLFFAKGHFSPYRNGHSLPVWQAGISHSVAEAAYGYGGQRHTGNPPSV